MVITRITTPVIMVVQVDKDKLMEARKSFKTNIHKPNSYKHNKQKEIASHPDLCFKIFLLDLLFIERLS